MERTEWPPLSEISSWILQTIFARIPSISTIAILVLLGLNLKNIPLAWHFRIINAFSYVLRSQRTHPKNGTCRVFDAVVTESISPVAEIDFNLHKSNSTYLSDVDIARTNLICTLFNRGIDEARFVTPQETTVHKDAQLTAMVAGVSCIFKGEIKPFQRYLMWSRLLCWDEKWFWIVTWFVDPLKRETKSGKLAERKVYATAISKCVWKKGRVTVRPSIMLQSSGLLQAVERESHDDVEEGGSPDCIQQTKTERQCQDGLTLLSTVDGVEKIHNKFNSNDSILATRTCLDFSPFLILRIVVLFGEWVVDRISRILGRSEIRGISAVSL